MTRRAIQILFIALLTVAPLAIAQAGASDSAEPTAPSASELSLPGMFVDCAGFEYADASRGVPDCIVKVVTAKLQQRIERDAVMYLQVKVQDQQNRLLAGKPTPKAAPVAAAADRADLAS